MTSALVQKPFTFLVEGNIGCGKTTFLQHFSEVITLFGAAATG